MNAIGVPAALTAVVVGLFCLALRPTMPARVPAERASSTMPAHRSAGTIPRSWPALFRRRPVLLPETVAAWCDELARHLRAGSSLGAALCESSSTDPPMRRSIEPMQLALERGATVAAAVATAPEQPMRGLEHLALACSVIATAAHIGGPAAAPLERVAAALRLRAIDRQDRVTQAAQARMSAHVLTVVPLLMLGVLTAADGDVRAAVASRAGALCVLLGLTLNVAGWSWMRRIIGGVR